MMRNRLWYELVQAKLSDKYLCLLIAQKRRLLNYFNIIIAVFSTAGVMGWKIWETIPVLACAIIAVISLLRLLQPHILPSDKQIERLDKANDFYFNFYLQLEKIWFDFDADRITEVQMQDQFHALKQSEREINQIINEIHKSPSKKITKIALDECNLFFEKAFNTKAI